MVIIIIYLDLMMIIPANIHDLKANTEDKLLDNSFWREKLVEHLIA